LRLSTQSVLATKPDTVSAMATEAKVKTLKPVGATVLVTNLF
jgi:hypothetical protein